MTTDASAIWPKLRGMIASQTSPCVHIIRIKNDYLRFSNDAACSGSAMYSTAPKGNLRRGAYYRRPDQTGNVDLIANRGRKLALLRYTDCLGFQSSEYSTIAETGSQGVQTVQQTGTREH